MKAKQCFEFLASNAKNGCGAVKDSIVVQSPNKETYETKKLWLEGLECQ
jgi:hypothetical protein